MNQLQLRQQRDVGALFRDAFAVFSRHALLFILLSAAVVVPAELIVEGIGLEMLTSSYDSSPSVAETVIPTIVEFLVVTPIIAAICIYALHQIAGGERPSAGQVLVAGFEAFTPLFAAVALAAAGIALGFVALIVPGVYLAVRWYFVPQTVVIEGARGQQALSRSGLRRDRLLVAHVRARAARERRDPHPGLHPAGAVHRDRRRALIARSGRWSARPITTSVTTPFVALYSTLLYYDLLARRAGVSG